VTGRSGIGKSSLVSAGFLSTISGPVKEIRPGANPTAVRIRKYLTALNGLIRPHYLFVDQYEELITTCTNVDERKDFEQALGRISKKHKIILALRSDFEYI